jgi:hypothetical protein
MSRLAGVPGVGALPPALGGMAAGGLPVPGMARYACYLLS